MAIFKRLLPLLTSIVGLIIVGIGVANDMVAIKGYGVLICAIAFIWNLVIVIKINRVGKKKHDNDY